MIRPHRRNTTRVSCSLDQRDLAFSAPIRVRAISISQPVLDQTRSGDQPHLAVRQESLESNLLSVAVLSAFVAFPRIATVGCTFEQIKTQPVAAVRSEARGQIAVPGSVFPARRYTRVRPPRDLVKLEDRLRLLLQPPLEALLAAQELRFSFQPFSFQLDGIAFLFPRQRAVLADEMGLGKAMQAVSAIRLLTHHGQL